MTDILTPFQLIKPVTENNIVNSINITSSQKHMNNFWIDSNFIKSASYSDNYTTTNNKIGQLKIKKFVNTRLFNTPYSIVSKAVKQKQVISLNTDNDKYMFIKNASREDLKKIKYYDYFGIRYDKEDNKLYDFDRRVIYHNVEKDPEDDDGIIFDKEDSEPMLDPFKYKHVFIDKHKFIPIKRYYVNEKESIEENTPQFINKQQNGIESEIIFPKRERSETDKSIQSEINTNPIGINGVNPTTESLIEPVEHVEPISPDEPTENTEPVEDPILSLTPSSNIEDIVSDHLENVINSHNISEQDYHDIKIILSGNNDEIEKINSEDISDRVRKTLINIKQDKIKTEKEVNKTEKDLRRTILRYIDKYDNSETAITLNSDPERYNINFLLNYFREMSEDDLYKVNKRSVDAVQRRIDKYNYNRILNRYYQYIPINQLNRLTKG